MSSATPLVETVPAIPCEQVASHGEYRHLTAIPNIAIDLRYATANNFAGRDLYTPLDCAWLHRDAAEALASASSWLAAHRTGTRLLVLDALRPQRVQEALWAALQGTPLLGYLAPPERGSIHSFGMAVDVTLIDADGAEFFQQSLDRESEGKLKDAITALEQLPPARRDVYVAVVRRAWLMYRLGQFESSVDAYRKAVALAPRGPLRPEALRRPSLRQRRRDRDRKLHRRCRQGFHGHRRHPRLPHGLLGDLTHAGMEERPIGQPRRAQAGRGAPAPTARTQAQGSR